jgi:hypothetical protein
VGTARGWGVVVRTAHGERLYQCAPGTRHGQQWSPRINQALRYATKAEAEGVAADFGLNSQAKEYLVVEL